jgi:hypothetical protein
LLPNLPPPLRILPTHRRKSAGKKNTNKCVGCTTPRCQNPRSRKGLHLATLATCKPDTPAHNKKRGAPGSPCTSSKKRESAPEPSDTLTTQPASAVPLKETKVTTQPLEVTTQPTPTGPPTVVGVRDPYNKIIEVVDTNGHDLFWPNSPRHLTDKLEDNGNLYTIVDPDYKKDIVEESLYQLTWIPSEWHTPVADWFWQQWLDSCRVDPHYDHTYGDYIYTLWGEWLSTLPIQEIKSWPKDSQPPEDLLPVTAAKLLEDWLAEPIVPPPTPDTPVAAWLKDTTNTKPQTVIIEEIKVEPVTTSTNFVPVANTTTKEKATAAPAADDNIKAFWCYSYLPVALPLHQISPVLQPLGTPTALAVTA